MKAKSVILSATLASGLIASAQASAEESPLEQVVGLWMSQAVAVTTQEIQNNVEQAVASAAYYFTLDGESVRSGSVSVKDIASQNTDPQISADAPK